MSLNIVIIGVGEVGYNLARSLSKSDYEITIVDIDPVKCNRVKDNIDAHVYEGDGASQRLLQKINMQKVDFLLALTRLDEVNLVASRIARKMASQPAMNARPSCTAGVAWTWPIVRTFQRTAPVLASSA